MRRLVIIALVLVSVSASSTAATARDLTFDDRVKTQEAIERIYYSHQTGANRPFATAVPREVLERKVRTYLEQTLALETIWHTPVTPGALQRELRRIMRSSRTPDRLEEIFGALGHDSFLIQECFVRPVLVNRLARGFLSTDVRFQGGRKARAETLRRRLVHGARTAPDLGAEERLVEVVVSEDEGRAGETAGERPSEWEQEGGLYRHRVGRAAFSALRARAPRSRGDVGPVTETPEGYEVRVLLEASEASFRTVTYLVRKVSWDAWWSGVEAGFDQHAVRSVARSGETLTLGVSAEAGAPSIGCVADDTWLGAGLDDPPVRSLHPAAVWTGSEMLTWGGYPQNSAARYDPLTDTWAALATKGAPDAADAPTVWTGSEMIVWGGAGASEAGRYDPVSDTWRSVSTAGAPAPPAGYAALWTGSTMIIWGGPASGAAGRYDPATDTWSPVSIVGAPDPRSSFSAVWSGREMILWGGSDGAADLASGGRYDPATDTWTPTSGLGAPTPRAGHTAVWAGNVMVVWGGYDETGPLGSGARYNPGTDSWAPVTGANAPSGRYGHTAVWSGTEMLVWGGLGTGPLSTGARYDPSADRWVATSTINAPAARWGQAAVWTGRQLLVWGGAGAAGSLDSGGRYDPASDSWTPTATASSARPSPRSGHSAVWTGNLMIIWGGAADFFLSSGASYDPLTASWTALPALDAPPPRSAHAAVWTGSVMLVWGGFTGDGARGTGGRFDPIAERWSSMNPEGSPFWNVYRVGVSAVWTGERLIVWGGRDTGEVFYGDGGRYDPATDRWEPLSFAGAPTARAYHSAVWSGGAMLVWGGFTRPFGGPDTWLDDGDAYLPASDSWTPLARTGAPSPRENHLTVWTGRQMLVWGGDGPEATLGDGAAYDARADTWAPIPSEGAPAPGGQAGLFERTVAAVWADPVMIVWGSGLLGSPIGGRYDVDAGAWKPVSESGAPPATSGFTAVWTGREMIAWGGEARGTPLAAGGAYQIDLSPDADRDGFTVCGGDCDDADPTVHPGAPELCNGRDDNCDGRVDEGFGVGTSCASDVDACHQLVGQEACNADGTGTRCAGVVTLHDLVPPAIVCPPATSLECPASAGSLGQASATDACDPAPVITRSPSGLLLLASTPVVWTATDASGNRSTCLQSLQVVDTTPPTITAAAAPSVLWPPNHRMVDVTESVAASDGCGTPAVSLTSIRSLEPDDAAGNGDGGTTDDIQGAEPGAADFGFGLRAERDGAGEGRVYEVTYSAVDAAGNRSVVTTSVFVPHDQAGSTEPLLIRVEQGGAGTLLGWDPVPGALAYRAIRGMVGSLRDAGASIDLGTVSCIQAASATTGTQGHEDAATPPLGEAFFYLVSYDDGRDSGYGTETAPKPRVVGAGGCE